MEELKAIKYGEVELIPGIKYDVYILNNGTPVMSERGVAELLGMNNKALKWLMVLSNGFVIINYFSSLYEANLSTRTPNNCPSFSAISPSF